MLNDEFGEQTSTEEMTGVYNYLIHFFLLDLDFTNTPEDIFEESINTHILFKNGGEIKKSIISQQEKRRNNFWDMIIEAYTTGESRKMTVSRCRDADYILEMNLIRSNDTRVEDYYKKNNRSLASLIDASHDVLGLLEESIVESDNDNVKEELEEILMSVNNIYHNYGFDILNIHCENDG